MPRYYFHIDDGAPSRDDDGVELPDASAAWNEATITCGEMLRDMNGALKIGCKWTMQVADPSGKVLFSIHVGAETF